MSRAEVELPRLLFSGIALDLVLVRFMLYFPVDRKKKAAAESARPDAGGYHRCKVVNKCAFTVKNELPLSGELDREARLRGSRLSLRHLSVTPRPETWSQRVVIHSFCSLFRSRLTSLLLAQRALGSAPHRQREVESSCYKLLWLFEKTPFRKSLF